jgi:hypothetical protein
MYKCEFCGKEFKTEKGFQRHSCEKKKRFMEFDEVGFRIWSIMNNVFKVRMPRKITADELKMRFVNDKSYKAIVMFAHWVVDNGVLDIVSYLQFLNRNVVPMKQWTTSRVYKVWLIEYLKNEPLSQATKRAEDYLSAEGLTLETVSQNRLYLLIRYGIISVKYLKSKNFNIRQALDDTQWFEIRPMVMASEVMDFNNAIHNS